MLFLVNTDFNYLFQYNYNGHFCGADLRYYFCLVKLIPYGRKPVPL
jgi:hypothetical protein